MMLAAYSIGPTGFTKARRPAIEDALRALADKQAPAVKRAILKAFSGADAATIKALAAALSGGRVEEVLALLGLGNLETRLGGMVSELRSAMTAAGGLAAATVPAIPQLIGPALEIGFDLYNPRTLRFLEAYEFKLVREVSNETRAGIRQVVSDGYTAGRNPRAVARDLKKSIGLTARQAQAVGNFRKELETFHLKQSAAAWNLGAPKSKAPGGAGVYAIGPDGKPLDGITARRLRDFRFDGTLRRAMETGKPLTPAQIDKMVDRYRTRMIAYRAENIAKTESLRAINAGNHEAWMQAAEQGVGAVVKTWRTAGDERVRLSHRQIPKMNPPEGVPIDVPFQTPNGPAQYPPLGVNCRCVAVYRVR
jgi:hypothetical protein